MRQKGQHSKHIYGPPEVRYEAKVDRSNGPERCHPWTASTTTKGYGQMNIDGRNREVHRWAFRMFVDPTLRDDEVVRHSCDNPLCQNPRHWVKGSRKDNAQDAVTRKRLPWSHQTHCRNGHPYDAENTYYRPDRPGSRGCRACNNASSLKYYPKRGHQPHSSREG